MVSKLPNVVNSALSHCPVYEYVLFGYIFSAYTELHYDHIKMMKRKKNASRKSFHMMIANLCRLKRYTQTMYSAIIPRVNSIILKALNPR